MYKWLKHISLTLALLVVLPGSTAWASDAKADQWKQAAINREWAAFTQLELAWQYAQEGEEASNRPHVDEKGRSRNQMAAANKLYAAANLELKAMTNYDKAAQCWRTAASGFGDAEQSTAAKQQAESDKADGTAAAERAAEHFEQAAETYRQLGEAGAGKSALMSERAAVCREALANR